ncbi:uncharacterized protein RJT21DRAFT_110920 [Scheffersomyces amazonensis]|uniref:uncharacterized protein n=1 Tax=Scheffersomyces amazonensis TaxID=1078765 RepID=UPI00315D7B8D
MYFYAIIGSLALNFSQLKKLISCCLTILPIYLKNRYIMRAWPEELRINQDLVKKSVESLVKHYKDPTFLLLDERRDYEEIQNWKVEIEELNNEIYACKYGRLYKNRIKLLFLLSCFPFITLKNEELTLDRLYTTSTQFKEDRQAIMDRISDEFFRYCSRDAITFVEHTFLLACFLKFPFAPQMKVPYSKYLQFPKQSGITKGDLMNADELSTEFTHSFDEFNPKLHIRAKNIEIPDLTVMINQLKIDVRAIERTQIIRLDILSGDGDISTYPCVAFKRGCFDPIKKLLSYYFPTFEFNGTCGIELFPTVQPPPYNFVANNHIVPVIMRYTGIHKNFNKAKRHKDVFSVSEDVRRLVHEVLYSMIYSGSLMGFALDVDSVLVIKLLSSTVVDTVVNPEDGTISKELDYEIFLLDHSLHYPMIGIILSAFLNNYFKTTASESAEVTREIRRQLRSESEELEASRQSKIEFVKMQYSKQFDDFDTAIGGYINMEFPSLFIKREYFDQAWALALIETFTSSDFQIEKGSHLTDREDIVHQFKGKLDGRSGTLYVYKISYTHDENEDFYKLVSVSLNQFLKHVVECISKFGKYKKEWYNIKNLKTVNDNFRCAYYERDDISGFSLLLFDDAQELDEADKVEEYEGDPPILFDYFGNQIENKRQRLK